VSLTQAVAQLDAPMVLLEHARHVDFSDGEHHFRYRSTVADLVRTLHLFLPVAASGSATVTATVHGEFLRQVRMAFASAGHQYLLTLRYEQVSHAPAVTAPPVTGVVP
jgi:hypothetical protein